MQAEKPGANEYILCANDSRKDQTFLTNSFYKVDPDKKLIIVHNGLEVMSFLSDLSVEELPCLIIIDQHMPFLNGKETLELLKADPYYSKIPVMLFSTSKGKIDEAMMHTTNAVYQIKHCSLDAWKNMAKRILDRCM